jgi:hypothetical protein
LFKDSLSQRFKVQNSRFKGLKIEEIEKVRRLEGLRKTYLLTF